MLVKTDSPAAAGYGAGGAGIHILNLPGPRLTNSRIGAQFRRRLDSGDVTGSHYFGGRFENIYLDLAKVPALDAVLQMAMDYAAGILGLDRGNLRIGYWFNEMKPGDSTTLHCHDESDELLAGVYYVDVPENSGSLVVWGGDEPLVIVPEEGMLVFFPPQVMHEVLENKSDHNRLSVGFNIGARGTGT